MIAIVDYGIGNLGSVIKGFRHSGAGTRLTGDPDELRSASALVLPGDGAFGATMDEIRRRGLVSPIEDAVARGVGPEIRVLGRTPPSMFRPRGSGFRSGGMEVRPAGAPTAFIESPLCWVSPSLSGHGPRPWPGRARRP